MFKHLLREIPTFNISFTQIFQLTSLNQIVMQRFFSSESSYLLKKPLVILPHHPPDTQEDLKPNRMKLCLKVGPLLNALYCTGLTKILEHCFLMFSSISICAFVLPVKNIGLLYQYSGKIQQQQQTSYFYYWYSLNNCLF